jgi:hypothetical protein
VGCHTAIERTRVIQKARMTWIRLGDANTKFFRLMANNRKKKNFIYSLQVGDGIVVTWQQKQLVVFNHFLNKLALMFLVHAN